MTDSRRPLDPAEIARLQAASDQALRQHRRGDWILIVALGGAGLAMALFGVYLAVVDPSDLGREDALTSGLVGVGFGLVLMLGPVVRFRFLRGAPLRGVTLRAPASVALGEPLVVDVEIEGPDPVVVGLVSTSHAVVRGRRSGQAYARDRRLHDTWHDVAPGRHRLTFETAGLPPTSADEGALVAHAVEARPVGQEARTHVVSTRTVCPVVIL